MRFALLLLPLLLLICMLATPALADNNTVRGNPKAAPPCPCPCDTQTMDNYLAGQLVQIANLLGQVGTVDANNLAQKLRDLGDKLRRGTITGDDALKAMQELRGDLQKLINGINERIDKVNADDKLTPKRKKSLIEGLEHQRDLLQRAIDGFTNAKGIKTLNGLSDLIECLGNCDPNK